MRLLVYFRASVLVDRGTPLRCRNLVSALARRGDLELLLVSRDPTPELTRRIAVDHAEIDRPEGAARALLRAARDFRPDVVYSQTDKGIPDMLTLLPEPGRKLVVDLHGDRASQLLEEYHRPLPYRVLRFLRVRATSYLQYPKMDAFTVVGEALARRVRRFGRPVEILWGGVDTDRFTPREAPARERLRIGYAGNYRPYQGVRTLLEAAEILAREERSFELELIGDVDSAPVMASELRAFPGDHLRLRGQLAYDEIPDALGACDVLVIPRVSDRSAQFGFPSKLPEYLALGKPVIVTDVGEHARLVHHLENGIVIPPDSPRELARALVALEDPSLRRRLGGEARDFAVGHLGWDRCADRLVRFLRQVAPSS